VRDVMTPEAARNVITAAELDAIAGNRKARKAFRKAAATAANANAPATSSMLRMASPMNWLPRAVPTPTGCASPVPRSAESAPASRHHGESAVTRDAKR
jgi:hypothetical protein